MTQQPAPPPDRGAVRAAVEGLLRACVDLERQAEAVAPETRKRVKGVLEALAAVRLPREIVDLPELAQKIDEQGRPLEPKLREGLAEARLPLVSEVHALLGLLAPWHGLAALPSLVPAAPGAALPDHFPAGFAQDYVKDLAATVDTSVTISARAASGVPVTTDKSSDALKALVADSLPADLQDEALRMLRHGLCHAVERHGHHIASEAQLARLVWLKDPTGHQVWQLLPDGAAESDHWCGPVSGGFTSAAAFAKPLAVFLRWAHDHAGGVNELIRKHTPAKAKRFGIHLSAELAGLVTGDAAELRGTVTTNKDRIADWTAARNWMMANGGPPVYAVPHDPFATSKDPGVTLAFRRVGENWHLVTCYPVDRQHPDNERLEDLT